MFGIFSSSLFASPKVGAPAPVFNLKAHDDSLFELEKRKGAWTVLYFYPKADTPGCTKQACAFRDSIQVIRDLGADVFGISTDSVDALKTFHEKYKLNFVLISDHDGKAAKDYGTRIPIIGLSRRHTFILDPKLVIRYQNTKVDPVMDSKIVAEEIKKLQNVAL